jgi:hypothetical protein
MAQDSRIDIAGAAKINQRIVIGVRILGLPEP